MQDYIISDDKRKREMIDGTIYLMASPCREHRDVQYNICHIFNEYFKGKKKCRAFFDLDVTIDKKNVLEPDLKVLCHENDKNNNVPVIIVEVLSKGTRERDLGVKMKKYAEFGIKEYWIITWELSLIDIYLLTEDKNYELYKSYSLHAEKPDPRDEPEEAVTEFSPVSFPELTIQLADVFDMFE